MAKKKSAKDRQKAAKRKVTELIDSGVAFNPKTISPHGRSIASSNLRNRRTSGIADAVTTIASKGALQNRISGSLSAPKGRKPRSSRTTPKRKKR